MAFLLAIPSLFIANDLADSVTNKFASAAESVQSFGIAIKRKLWDKKKPQERHEYSKDYQKIKEKYQKNHTMEN